METITVQAVINLQGLQDLITTALEGGSNYWYLLNREATDKIRKYKGRYVPEIHGDNEISFFKTLTEAFLVAVMEGEVIPIHDAEDEDEKIGEVSIASIKKGLEKMQADKRTELNYLLGGEDYDAGDADVVFQYIALGELVYG